MLVTKYFSIHLGFASGSATVLEGPHGVEALRQSLWRAQAIPRHRIEVVGWLGTPTADERELLRRRVDHVVQAALAAGISSARIETSFDAWRVDPEARTPANSRSYVEFTMYPDVASLSGDADDPRLTRLEQVLLARARHVVWINRDADATRALDAQHDRRTWRRLFGHDTLTQWAAAGADHPLWTRG